MPEGRNMRSLFRNPAPLFLAAAFAVPVLVTGCQSQAPAPVATQAAPEDDKYVQWEHETHRDHVDLAKRNDDERKQYNDWRANHR
jgi:hypothetical protein